MPSLVVCIIICTVSNMRMLILMSKRITVWTCMCMVMLLCVVRCIIMVVGVDVNDIVNVDVDVPVDV